MNKLPLPASFVSYMQPDMYPIVETGYHCGIRNPFSDFNHGHDFYEIIYCTSGKGIHIVNNRPYDFSGDSICILRPGDKHYFIEYKSATALTICVHVKEFKNFLTTYGLENDAKLQCNSSEEPVFLQIPNSDIHRFRKTYETIIIREPLSRTPYLKIFIGNILSCLLQERHPRASAIPDSFRKVLLDMNQLTNLHSGVTAFLKLSNLSHAQLCRLTKKYLNLTPNEYVTQIRMEFAYSYITSTSIGFEDIADMIGFSSYSHFYKLFKNKYQISPSQLRQKSV